jgi:hypothetical protein
LLNVLTEKLNMMRLLDRYTRFLLPLGPLICPRSLPGTARSAVPRAWPDASRETTAPPVPPGLQTVRDYGRFFLIIKDFWETPRINP